MPVRVCVCVCLSQSYIIIKTRICTSSGVWSSAPQFAIITRKPVSLGIGIGIAIACLVINKITKNFVHFFDFDLRHGDAPY